MSGPALLGLMALLGLTAGAPLCLSRQLRTKGDYVLGGLFPLGSAEDTGPRNRTPPHGTVCGRFSASGLLWALAAKMAVEEINNGSALLPGLRLGYDLLDTCSDPVVAVKPSLTFAAKAGSRDVAVTCNYTHYRPRVLAVIGPHSSELALVTGKFFSFLLVPQVSYGASADRLSDRGAFPSFFRTVPSDRMQAVALVELLEELGWNWVAALGSDDEYGRQGLSLFSGLATVRGICIALEGLAPLPGAAGLRRGAPWALLRQVNQSTAQAVVLFASAPAAHALLGDSIRGGLVPKVWLASEAWLTSDLVLTLHGIARVGTVLGFLQQGAPLPELSSYVQARLTLAADPAFCSSLDAEQPGLEEQVVGPRCPQCDHVTLENVSAGPLTYQTFAAYAAVYGVAQALHSALLCSPSGCPVRQPLQPWQLLEHMHNMRFQARGRALQFDTSGSVGAHYDLKLWVWRDPEPELRTVGTFDGRLQLQRSRLYWHTPGSEEPVSRCSRRCGQGQVRRVKGLHSCCYDCVDCKAGSYQRSPDDVLCTRCDQDQWSPDRSTRCFPRRPKFLAWGEPVVLVLLLLLSLALGLVLAVLGLFLQHRDSPLVRAAGGPRACFGLACLGLVCLSTLLLPGRPSPAGCRAQQLLLHLPLTGCLSALSLQAAQVFVGPELSPSWAHRLCARLQGPCGWLAVLLAMLAEAALCAWYLAAFPPKVVTDWQVLPTEALVHCRLHSWASLSLVHATNATLASLCFLLTFQAQSQPGRYSAAHGLTFAMLTYFTTWVSFLPLLANVPVAYQPAVHMGAVLLCVLGILATFHLPKCYLLLWQPECNTPQFFLRGSPGSARGKGAHGCGQETQGKNE